MPNKSHAMGSGAEFHVGPHIMIVGLDQKMMQTLNRTHRMVSLTSIVFPDTPSCIW